eukprot:3913364-Pyramimonas_sp.AAC.1
MPTPAEVPPRPVAAAGIRSAAQPARRAPRAAAASCRSSARWCAWIRMACAESPTWPSSS